MQPSILITGANGGIGNATAHYFLSHNPEAFVYLGIRSGKSQAQSLAAEFPGRATLLPLDVSSEEAWKTALATIESDNRVITILVNNAGHHDDHLLANMPAQAWSSVIQSNLTSTYLGSQAVLHGMMTQRFGRIINIASLSALLAPLGQTNYAAAKAGVVAMTQSLAKETARMGITANSICPGYIETPATAEMDPETKKQRKKSIPMRRFGTPREVAAAVFFLASKEAGYITGSFLKIDGGIL